MTSRHTLAAAFILTVSAFQTSAQEFGDVQKGQAFAQMVCAECHSVTARPALSPNSEAPAFSAVANTSGMTAMALRTWMQTSNPTMPNIILKTEDRDNVIAYILSLNRKNKGL